ncbi:MAG: O-antigen ligase family protein [Candidatus Woesebacteria bacterium]|nr:MAG: O-antigen ligase family protein [Candidatus Woesebacteria bacterium]
MDKLQKTIFVFFAILFFFVPLVLWPYTSEVFEFNKIVLVYGLTVLITGTWVIRMILERKIIFRRTILDIPLLVFFASQLISTLLSIDPSTSWFGYYSRFNGGLLSTISYTLLYWTFVSNLDRKHTLRILYTVLCSAAIVSIYGVLEHWGIDKALWVQDVKSRVFSTLGQPNWLAAYVVALLPITWALALEKSQISNPKSQTNSKFLIYFSLSVLFFWTLIFTKSRSGLLGLGVAFIIFWAGYFWINRLKIKNIMFPFAIITSSLLIICLISGTQFTPSISDLLNKSRMALPSKALASEGPALEVGGTESGTIRKIVWTGAVEVWKHYPIFGTGVETFAFSYYQYRPVEHNLVSEWDFIYNKAHNEYLNIAANSGSFGLLSYLILIGFSIYQTSQVKNQNLEVKNTSKNSKIESQNFSLLNCNFDFCLLNFALLAGYASLLITNFFGFSVVPTQLQLFLFPAIAVILSTNEELRIKNEKFGTRTNFQKLGYVSVIFLISYFLFLISRYWYADTQYALGKAYNGIQRQDVAANYLIQAVNIEPWQPLYHSELANSYAAIALALYNQKDAENSKKYTELAISESDRSINLSSSLNLKRSRFGVFVVLSTTNPDYLRAAQETLIGAITLAPTDAKLYYNLALTYARTNQPDRAMEVLINTIGLKANYRDARLAYAYLLMEKKEYSEAKTQLTYILKYIDPNDPLAKQALEGIK